MRAVQVSAPGGRERLSITDLPTPVLAPGHVLVAMDYAACNWGDIQKRQGIYPDPVSYPAVLGAEGAGRVMACGAGVRGFREQPRVALIGGPSMAGCFAEYVSVPQEYVFALPPELGSREAAVLPVAALTAWHLLHSAHSIRRGERILVHAASGGVGLALVQIARNAGARVFGTVGSQAKAALPLSLGADRVYARNDEDFVAALMRDTAGKGVDLVIDSLGASELERSFGVLRPFGRLINIGEAAGEPDFDIRKALYRRSTFMAGFELLHAKPGSRRWRHGVTKVIAAVLEKRLQMPVAAEFALEDIAEAQALLEGRGTIGKVLIRINGSASG